MIETQTLDMVIGWSSGGMPRSAWQLTASAYPSAVSYQAEHGLPPSDRQIILSVRSLSLDHVIVSNDHVSHGSILNVCRMNRTLQSYWCKNLVSLLRWDCTNNDTFAFFFFSSSGLRTWRQWHIPKLPKIAIQTQHRLIRWDLQAFTHSKRSHFRRLSDEVSCMCCLRFRTMKTSRPGIYPATSSFSLDKVATLSPATPHPHPPGVFLQHTRFRAVKHEG